MNLNGEGFAFFRWRTLNLLEYILPISRSHLVNCWPRASRWARLQIEFKSKKLMERMTDQALDSLMKQLETELQWAFDTATPGWRWDDAPFDDTITFSKDGQVEILSINGVPMLEIHPIVWTRSEIGCAYTREIKRLK